MPRALRRIRAIWTSSWSFSAPTYDHFVGLERFLEQLFDRPVDILTPAGVDSIRVPQIVEDIKRTILHV
jgi:predicted nucleotidyltransferase